MAETAGRLCGCAKAHGRVLSAADALMAATALATVGVLVTRNTKDFKGIEVPLLNPFTPPS